MAEDIAILPAEYREYRRAVVASYGHFRVDRIWYRAQPSDAEVHYDVVFEVDASGEFDLGSLIALRGILSWQDLRRDAFAMARLWRQAHSSPSQGRPVPVPYYHHRVGLLGAEHEAPAEKWYQDRFFRRTDRTTIDVDEAATLIEAALHELEERETGKEGGSTS